MAADRGRSVVIWRFVAWLFAKISPSAQSVHDDFHPDPIAGCGGCAIREDIVR